MKKITVIAIGFAIAALLGFCFGRASVCTPETTSFFHTTAGGLNPDAPVFVYASAERDAELYLSEVEPSAHLDIDLSLGGGYSITISGDVEDGAAESVGKHFQERLSHYLRQHQEHMGASNQLLHGTAESRADAAPIGP